uniref:Uncharacterized protein n=1 Tax=Hanusia phi TaxID=3032 RepID=A0A7S0EDL1_9CRYP|mmetsp:Transcript_22339/g.50360  ORF Transcript_22339/g.50360 Transcript_22339/m.50360 type:complete len:361 (+) Transcript_22339:106-1188(+)
MSGYIEVSDEDRRWASATYSEETIFRGPCGPVFNMLDWVLDQIKEQSSSRIAFLLLGLLFLVGLGNTIIEDEKVPVLVKGGELCAAEEDLLDQEDHRCRVEDKLAVGFLRMERWVNCADFTRGGKILSGSQDEAGNFWYDVKEKHKVAFFYSTCNPTCASESDRYFARVPSCDHGMCKGGMCKVGDHNAIAWLESRRTRNFWSQPSAYKCRESPSSRPGIEAIEAGSENGKKMGKVNDGEYYYDPKKAAEVRSFYKGCEGPCACNDGYDERSQRCFITDQAVRIFFDPAPNAPGDVKGPHQETINVMNAYCKQLGGEIQMIKRQGDLSGDFSSMSYLPAVKQHVLKLYRSCARHVPCPGN